MSPGATTHGNDMNQRHVELAVTPTAGGLTAVAPANANLAPPGDYMLFVLNADGVPSVARWVRLGGTAPPPPPNQAPTAAFTVAPAAPQTGQQATFTDTSTDTDGTIAARAWDLDNDGAFDDGTGATATRTFAAAGTYTVRLQVTDDDGAPAVASGQVSVSDAPPPPPPPPPPPGNLVANPSFETGTVGWSGFQGTLVREAQAGAPNGAYVARVTRSSGTYFTIDGGNNVSPTLATTYTATAWVRAASASSVGKPIQIKLRERTASGAAVADVGSANVLLTNAWQQLTVTRTTAAGNQLGVRLSHGSATTGDAFFADAFALSTGTAPPPPPTRPRRPPSRSRRPRPDRPAGDLHRHLHRHRRHDRRPRLGPRRRRRVRRRHRRHGHAHLRRGRHLHRAPAGDRRRRRPGDGDAPGGRRGGPAASPNQAPTAAFTVAPAAPQTGQQATFTDTSTDTDGTIAARAWDLDNDGAFDDGTGATATRTFAAAGTYTVRLQVTDDDGAPAVASGQVSVSDAPPPPPPPPPPPGNLVANPSFETGTVGWSGFQGTLVREAQAGAPNGAYVARVTRSSGTYFTIDGGNNVSPTLATTYTATAWVRAASASSVGKPIQIKLRERTASGAAVADVGSANVLLTNAWQQLTVTRTTAAGNQLGVRLSHGSAITGDAFFADAFAITRG